MSSSKYEVEERDGCTIVRGMVPVSALVHLTRRAPKGSVMDTGLSVRIGAAFVFSPPQKLAALRSAGLPACARVRAEIERARQAGLGPDAYQWLDGYERGRSSDCLFRLATGVEVGSPGVDLPRDSADLGRCLNLVQSVAAVRDNLDRAKREPAWAKLLDEWSELEQLHAQKEHGVISARLQG